SSRNYKSKYRKPSRLFNDKLPNETGAHNCQESTSSSENPRILSNKKENDSTLVVKRSLEDLFLEKKCDWNPKEFTNTAVAKRLCLDDNPIKNSLKLYRWISNQKIRTKSANNINI
ncbi:259_t:CDS:2, partial [Cetraspora pellucida]